jgi:hypothetical protein
MKIGITERGDAGIDLSWTKKLPNVDGAILITKNLNDNFIEAVLRNKDKVIVHITCTGYGGTVLEPNVPDVEWTFEQIRKLLKTEFDSKKLVLRIDPIIPTQKGIARFVEIYAHCPYEEVHGEVKGIDRVRISVLDMYPHVRKRFADAGVPSPYGDSFTASDEQFAFLNNTLEKCSGPDRCVQIEACAEPRLMHVTKTGCISTKDLQLLGLKESDILTGGQRKGCLCLTSKTELLDNKRPCEHNCMYCYWQN